MCATQAVETQVTALRQDRRSRPTLSESQRNLLQSLVRDGVKTTREIAKEVGCAERTVRKYAAKQGVRAPSRLEALDRAIADRNADLAERAYNALLRLNPEVWLRAGITRLSAMVERHDALVSRHVQAERERQAPPPAYQPNPLFAFLLGLFGSNSLTAARQAGQTIAMGVEGRAALLAPGHWLGAVAAQEPAANVTYPEIQAGGSA